MLHSSSAEIDPNKILDVRAVPCSSKHNLILQRWGDLPVNDYFVLVNAHDPRPLYAQFAAEFPGAFTWDYLARGPEGVRIKITKIRPVTVDRSQQWTCPED